MGLKSATALSGLKSKNSGNECFLLPTFTILESHCDPQSRLFCCMVALFLLDFLVLLVNHLSNPQDSFGGCIQISSLNLHDLSLAWDSIQNRFDCHSVQSSSVLREHRKIFRRSFKRARSNLISPSKNCGGIVCERCSPAKRYAY